MPSAYEDFLSGVQSANWLGIGRTRRVRIGNDIDEEGSLMGRREPWRVGEPAEPVKPVELPKLNFTALNPKPKPKPAPAPAAPPAPPPPSAAKPSIFSIWSPARIAGAAVGGVLSLGAVVLGALIVAGVVVLTVAATAEVQIAPSPPPPSPPSAPPVPLAPPGAIVTALSACVFEITGVPIDFTNNGVCEDGGPGSIDSFCSLGSDHPDCPPRFEFQSPLPPSPPSMPMPLWVPPPSLTAPPPSLTAPPFCLMPLYNGVPIEHCASTGLLPLYNGVPIEHCASTGLLPQYNGVPIEHCASSGLIGPYNVLTT